MSEPGTLKPISWAVTISLAVVGTIMILTVAIGGSYYLSLQQQKSQRQEQLTQGIKELSGICHTLDQIAALKPPAGDPTTNPSRAYEQKFHETIIQLRPDLGCQRLP